MITFESKFSEEKYNKLEYATVGSAAIDLRAYLPHGHHVMYPEDSFMIDLGIRMDLSSHAPCVGLIFPRSGLGSRGVGSMGAGIVLTNNVGVIDGDYRGDIKVPLINRSCDSFVIKHGDRVCQMIIMPIIIPGFQQIDNIDDNTARGISGFGSTGI